MRLSTKYVIRSPLYAFFITSTIVCNVSATNYTKIIPRVVVLVAVALPVFSLDDKNDDDNDNDNDSNDDHVLDARRDSTTFYLISAPRVLCISINFQILVRTQDVCDKG